MHINARISVVISLTMASLALSACSGDATPAGKGAESGGALVIATPAEPSNLMPPVLISLAEKQIADQI